MHEIIYNLFISTRNFQCYFMVCHYIMQSETVIVMISLYRVIQEERSVRWEMKVSVIMKKKRSSYVHVSICEWPYRRSCLNLQTRKHTKKGKVIPLQARCGPEGG